MVYMKLRDRQHQENRERTYKVENTENISDKEHSKWGNFMP
jgi:hypothetical protein